MVIVELSLKSLSLGKSSSSQVHCKELKLFLELDLLIWCLPRAKASCSSLQAAVWIVPLVIQEQMVALAPALSLSVPETFLSYGQGGSFSWK